MSAAQRAAFSNMPGLDPGTASSDRCRRGVACSMIVKLTFDLLGLNPLIVNRSRRTRRLRN